jgi:hypothetical protein
MFCIRNFYKGFQIGRILWLRIVSNGGFSISEVELYGVAEGT